MKFRSIFILFVFAITALFSLTTFTSEADARAGGGRSSSGSRGSRSYSKPAATTAPQAQRPSTPPPVQAAPPASSGGFFRSMAGGIAGGLLGGMLFRSMGFAGPGGAGGGGGMGFFEIILIGGIIYLIYRYIKKRREEAAGNQNNISTFEPVSSPYQQSAVAYEPSQDDVATGIGHIRQMDYNFDEQRFNDSVMDTFFKIQSAWMNRDLTPIGVLLTAPMRQTFQSDIDQLIREKKVNHLENIAVRKVEIVEVWQESGQDFITTLIYANLLDYTTDDAAGQVVSGSKTDPVKFEEYWTFTRPVGSNPWQLSAIEQK